MLSRALCCLDTSLPCCSFPDCRNHSVFLPKGLLGHLILGKTCLFLLKRFYLGLLDHFTLLTARVLWASSAEASLHDLMDQVSWHPIWRGVRVLQGTLGNLLLSHILRRRHVLCQINLLQVLLAFLWKTSRSFFQSRDKAPMTRARTCSGEPGAGRDGWPTGMAKGWGDG